MTRMSIDQAAALAVQHHQAGRLREAETIYRQILQSVPQHFDATQLLGLVLYQTRRYADALPLLESAVASNPAAWGPRSNLALTLMELGRLEESLRHADAVLAANPTVADAMFCRAAVFFERGEWDESIGAWRQLLDAHPRYAPAWASLGATLEKSGRLEEALAACERAIALDPNQAGAIVNLGSVKLKLGNPKEALELHRRALAIDNDNVAAWSNLALAEHELRHYPEAAAAARRAIELDPRDIEAHRNLTAALQELGQIEDAAREIATIIDLLKQRGRVGDGNLINHLRLAGATMLPSVYESVEHIAKCRTQLIERIAELRRDEVLVDVTTEAPTTLFPLAYQGENDREIMQSITELLVAPSSPLSQRKPSGKIRIAFLSRFLRDHTIGRLNLGLIRELSRERFDVTVLKLTPEEDEIVTQLRAAADQYIVLPSVLERARAEIAEQAFDVLFYTDIGMDPLTHALAVSRLAPVQCATWGHPVTSGMKSIDYFISCTAMEPPGSEQQYTERLVRLSVPAVFYYRPTLQSPAKTRADFKLSSDATIYGCLQSLFKLHPEVDALIGGVLRRDRNGTVLLLHGLSAAGTEKLTQRLRRTIPDVIDRVRIMPGMPYHDFLALTSLCDVMLDPIHFGGGNTSYEAFAFGVPVITWPSQMARGRIALALYEQMGVMDCIVATHQQYVELATFIAMTSARRRETSEKILAAHSKVFENPTGVRELESFLRGVVNRA